MQFEDPELVPILYASIVSMIISLLRGIYDGDRRFIKTFIESMLIGTITFSIGFALKAMEINQDWVYSIGAIIGLVGVDYLRQISKKQIEKIQDEL